MKQSAQFQSYSSRKQAVARFRCDKAANNGNTHKVTLCSQLILSCGSSMRVCKPDEILNLLDSDYKTVTIGKDEFSITLPIDSNKIVSIN
jgi:hypothetical protein